MQTELQVQTRAELLEQQNQLILRQKSANEQIKMHQECMKKIRKELKGINKTLDIVSVKLEANQITLGVK